MFINIWYGLHPDRCSDDRSLRRVDGTAAERSPASPTNPLEREIYDRSVFGLSPKAAPEVFSLPAPPAGFQTRVQRWFWPAAGAATLLVIVVLAFTPTRAAPAGTTRAAALCVCPSTAVCLAPGNRNRWPTEFGTKPYRYAVNSWLRAGPIALARSGRFASSRLCLIDPTNDVTVVTETPNISSSPPQEILSPRPPVCGPLTGHSFRN